MFMFLWYIIQIIILVTIILVLLSGFTFIQQYERAVKFRFGKLVGVMEPGFAYVFPIIESITRVDMRVISATIPGQEIITSDAVPMHVEAMVMYKVIDAIKSVVEIENLPQSITLIAQTSLRNSVGHHSMQDLLSQRDKVASEITRNIGQSANDWGVAIDRVEIRDARIPAEMQRVMAAKASATQEQEAQLIQAETEVKSAERYAEAARIIAQNPAALELRRMQLLREIGAEQQTTTIMLIPSEFVNAAGAFAHMHGGPASNTLGAAAEPPKAPAESRETPQAKGIGIDKTE